VIHHCEAHGCARIFFRTHGRRRWCSNTCGDRVRVARHYLARKGRLAKASPPVAQQAAQQATH
jgi:predicted RNA-binding Zn ribbon-like protein